MAQHIIVGFDGSPQSEDALVLGRQLATAVRVASGPSAAAALHTRELEQHRSGTLSPS